VAARGGLGRRGAAALGVRLSGRALRAGRQDEARGIAVRADRPAGRREPEGAPLGSALLGYNAAFSYALAVAHLSDRLRGEPGFVRPWVGHEPGLGLPGADRRPAERADPPVHSAGRMALRHRLRAAR
jgi:hypothetical protein